MAQMHTDNSQLISNRSQLGVFFVAQMGQFDATSADAGNRDEPYRDLESWKRSLEKSVDGGIIKSTRSGALNPDSEDANSHAERYYGLVRKMTMGWRRGCIMIKLKNIKNEDGIISCIAYVEDCEPGIPAIYDAKRDVLTHGDLPQEYDWCTGHFAYARRALKKMVNSGVFEESKIIMWY